MGNQQLSILEPTAFLARNAVLGDGYLWKHPECKNYKAIWTSTTPELLEVKRAIAPELFKTGVMPASTGRSNGRFANAKQLYRLASTVNATFTAYKTRSKESLFAELTIVDFALWYLDDGCCVQRRDARTGHRFTLSIGDCAATPERRELFTSTLVSLFGEKYGRVYKNNSKAGNNNLVWIMTKDAAHTLLDVARGWGIMPHKFPR